MVMADALQTKADAMSGNGKPQVITKVVYRSRSSAGLFSGIFGCIFAILGIFTFGLVFLPFACLFSLVSLLRSASGVSASGFCAAVASCILTVIGFVVSPTTWLVLIGLLGLAVTNVANHPTAPQASELMQQPVCGSALESENSDGNSSPPDTTLPDSALPAMTPPPEDSASPPVAPQLSTLQGFAAGAADRAVMEAWFNSLTGGFKDGAEFWAANRSIRPQPTCEGQEANEPPTFYQGCVAAKDLLDQVDVRRLSDPKYRAGWNTPPT